MRKYKHCRDVLGVPGWVRMSMPWPIIYCLASSTCERDVTELLSVQGQTLVDLLMVLLAYLNPASSCQTKHRDYTAKYICLYSENEPFATIVYMFETFHSVLFCNLRSPDKRGFA